MGKAGGVSVHFMGMGGSGVSGVAKLAEKVGYHVTGCDLSGESAYSKHIIKGHDASHVKGADLVVVSPAIFYQNPRHSEVLEARKQKKLCTWQRFLGNHLHKGKKVICVAGTHGKSTTTAMAGKLLIDAGFDPSVLVGAKVSDWEGSSRWGKGNYFITEADEFFDNFLNYRPDIIILNNIEFDHPDYFNSEDAVFNSFRKFVSRLVGQKILIGNGDDPGVIKLLKSVQKSALRVLLYHSDNPANPKLKLRVLGKHNIQNALGVVELGKILKIPESTVVKSLESFCGIGRRLEVVYDKRGIVVYDDYAHHPTAVAATLAALRGKFPKRRIWAVVEPHGFERSRRLLKKYKGAFRDADRVIIGPVFKARDKLNFGVTPELIAKATGHSRAGGYLSFEIIKEELRQKAKSGDVILVMGAGESYLWAKNIFGN